MADDDGEAVNLDAQQTADLVGALFSSFVHKDDRPLARVVAQLASRSTHDDDDDQGDDDDPPQTPQEELAEAHETLDQLGVDGDDGDLLAERIDWLEGSLKWQPLAPFVRRTPVGFIDEDGKNHFDLAPGEGCKLVAKSRLPARVDRLLIVPSAPGIVIDSIDIGGRAQEAASQVPAELYSLGALTDAVPDSFSDIGPDDDVEVSLHNTAKERITGTVGLKVSVAPSQRDVDFARAVDLAHGLDIHIRVLAGRDNRARWAVKELKSPEDWKKTQREVRATCESLLALIGVFEVPPIFDKVSDDEGSSGEAHADRLLPTWLPRSASSLAQVGDIEDDDSDDGDDGDDGDDDSTD